MAANLEGLWKRAESHLSQADTVFFIGYSFPKSDSEALRRILDALKLKECAADIRDFHVVLGPELNSTTRRVVALLQACASGRSLMMLAPEEMASKRISEPNYLKVNELKILRIKQHPLWTQDFIGNWQTQIAPIDSVRQDPRHYI